jgi:hypothetical protein
MSGTECRGTARAALLTLMMAGCGPQPELVPGELGNGLFYWLCTSLADPSCESLDEGAMDFPTVVALGSDFALQYQSNDSGRYLAVRSGSSHLAMGSTSGAFTAVLPGFASVVVYEGEELYDFLHLEVQPVDRLQITTAGLPSQGLDVGDDARILVSALCGDVPCAGALPYQWSVDRPDVLELEAPVGPDDEVRVRALSPGLATVTVLADTVAVIQIEVLGDSPVETGETGTEPEDTGTEDTGTEDTGTVDTGVGDTGAQDTGVTP